MVRERGPIIEMPRTPENIQQELGVICNRLAETAKYWKPSAPKPERRDFVTKYIDGDLKKLDFNWLKNRKSFDKDADVVRAKELVKELAALEAAESGGQAAEVKIEVPAETPVPASPSQEEIDAQIAALEAEAAALAEQHEGAPEPAEVAPDKEAQEAENQFNDLVDRWNRLISEHDEKASDVQKAKRAADFAELAHNIVAIFDRYPQTKENQSKEWLLRVETLSRTEKAQEAIFVDFEKKIEAASVDNETMLHAEIDQAYKDGKLAGWRADALDQLVKAKFQSAVEPVPLPVNAGEEDSSAWEGLDSIMKKRGEAAKAYRALQRKGNPEALAAAAQELADAYLAELEYRIGSPSITTSPEEEASLREMAEYYVGVAANPKGESEEYLVDDPFADDTPPEPVVPVHRNINLAPPLGVETVTAVATTADTEAAENEVAELEGGTKGLWGTLKEKMSGWFKRDKAAEEPGGTTEGPERGEDEPKEPVGDPSSPGFWSDIDKRFSAYVRGELTESEQKGLEQDKRWVLARAGMETAATVFGAKIVTELSRAYFTNKEFQRLQGAIKESEFVTLDSGEKFEIDPTDRAKEVEEAIWSSKYLTETKKAELIAKVNGIMDAYLGSVDKADEEDRDYRIARGLDISLGKSMRMISASKEAVNTALVVGTLGIGRSAVFAGYSQLERMIKSGQEAVWRGESRESLTKAFGEAAWKGFSDTAKQFNILDKTKSRGAKALGVGLGVLTIAKYYGLATVGFEGLSNSEAIDKLTDELDAQAPAGAPEVPATQTIEQTIDQTELHSLGMMKSAPAEVETSAPEVVAGSEAAATASAQTETPATGETGEAAETPATVEAPEAVEAAPVGEAMKVRHGDGFVSLFNRAIEQEASEAGVKLSHSEARKIAAKLVAEKGLMGTWLSKASEGNLAVDVEFEGDEVKDVHFIEVSTGAEVAVDDLDHKGFTMEPIEDKGGGAVENKGGATTPRLPTSEAPAQEGYFAVPGEDGTPEDAQIMPPGEAEVSTVPEPEALAADRAAAGSPDGAQLSTANLSVESAAGGASEAVSVRIPGHGLLEIPEGAYSQEEADRLVAEARMRGDMDKIYEQILREAKGRLRFKADDLELVERYRPHVGAEADLVRSPGTGSSDRFLKQLENYVNDDGGRLEQFMKDVHEGKAEITDLTPKTGDYSSKQALNKAFETFEARFKNRPFNAEQWEKVKASIERKWKG